MAMMVQPPAVPKTRLPAGFLTLLYNQCLPSVVLVKCLEITHTNVYINQMTHVQCKHSCYLSEVQTDVHALLHTSQEDNNQASFYSPTFTRAHAHSLCVGPCVCDRKLNLWLSVYAWSVCVVLKCQLWAFNWKIRY